MDSQLHQLEHAAESAPRLYRFVVLSDHGQSTGPTFRQRFGLTLDQLVHQLIEPGQDTQLAGGRGEGWGQLNALVQDVIRVGGTLGRTTLRVVGQTDPHQPVDIDPAGKGLARVEAADGYVLLESEASGGPVVLGQHGRHDLRSDVVTGDDPLAPFSPHTADFLRRLSSYADVGDIVVNSHYDAQTGQVAAFEELIGCQLIRRRATNGR